MTTSLRRKGPLYLPTCADPVSNQLFQNALDCPQCGAGQQRLWPAQSISRPGVFVVMCGCGHIGGDAHQLGNRSGSEATSAQTEAPDNQGPRLFVHEIRREKHGRLKLVIDFAPR